jgi:5'-3' exonuclease
MLHLNPLNTPTPQVTSEHNEECKKLLRLMGVPVIDAPSEAEAQCAAMAKAGVVYGAATEDMDCLTFGCPTLIRHLMAPASQNAAIQEFSLSVLLEVRRVVFVVSGWEGGAQSKQMQACLCCCR